MGAEGHITSAYPNSLHELLRTLLGRWMSGHPKNDIGLSAGNAWKPGSNNVSSSSCVAQGHLGRAALHQTSRSGD